jgi:hypothetical protein
MKTADVKLLVREVLEAVPKPYSEHVIQDVFLLIEQTPKWHKEYDRLVKSLGKDVVNNWGGSWVAQALGKTGERQVSSQSCALIGSYSILDTDARTVAKKPKEAEALEMMSAYYQAHKADLPPEVRKYRDEIVNLIMEGMPAEQAFAVALRPGV